MEKSIMAMGILLLGIILQGCAGYQGARLVNQEGTICQDKENGLMWQVERSTSVDSLQEAEAYISRLNQGKYSDWRLPTVTEMFDLYYIFDLHQNGDCDIERKGRYWSRDKEGDAGAGAWEIGNQCDPARVYRPSTIGGYVRAVRP